MKNWTDSNILAIDSSGRTLRLGLAFGSDRMVKSDEVVEQSHGQVIVKKIGELFESAAMDKGQLDGICVCTGPGSFTGLRIGLAAAKGMAVALDIPVVGVNLFEIAAYKLRQVDMTVAVVIPLKRDEVFVASVRPGELFDGKIRVVPVDSLSAAISEEAVAGIQFEPGQSFSGLKKQDLSEKTKYDAGDLIYLGREKFAKNLAADLSLLEPLYVQKSQAEIKFELRNKS